MIINYIIALFITIAIAILKCTQVIFYALFWRLVPAIIKFFIKKTIGLNFNEIYDIFSKVRYGIVKSTPSELIYQYSNLISDKLPQGKILNTIIYTGETIYFTAKLFIDGFGKGLAYILETISNRIENTI